MVKAAKMLLGVMVVSIFTAPLLGQGALAAQKRAQAKALSLRAARVDAMRKLGEKINGLSITSSTKVKDFVTESDQIRTAMEAFLLGMREVGRPEFSEDGVCTVKMEVTLQEVIIALRRIHSEYYKRGKKFKYADFTKMSVTNKIKILRVVGNGAPRPEPEHKEDELVAPDDFGTVSFAKFSKEVKSYWKKYCTGQGRLMAERAARLDAMRRLAERIKGVHIDSKTSVKDFVAESDNVNVSMRTFLRGFKEVGVRYHSDDLICEVEIQIKLKQVYAMIHSWAKVHYKGNKTKMRMLEKKTLKTETRIIKETGMGVPPARYLKKTVPTAVKVVAEMAKKAPLWATRVEKAIGNGAIDANNPNKAQAKLMAYRAAELDGRRKLAERIRGLMISSKTSVRDFVAESDEIRTSMLTFQTGAYVVEGSQRLSEDGVAQVTVAIEMKPLWNSIIFFKKKLGMTIK